MFRVYDKGSVQEERITTLKIRKQKPNKIYIYKTSIDMLARGTRKTKLEIKTRKIGLGSMDIDNLIF